MKTITPNLLLAITLCGLIAPTQAADPMVPSMLKALVNVAPCQALMTEKECDQHKATLAQLNPGPTRDRYLAEHALLLQEREAACSCNRQVMAETIYPHRRQAMLKY